MLHLLQQTEQRSLLSLTPQGDRRNPKRPPGLPGGRFGRWGPGKKESR